MKKSLARPQSVVDFERVYIAGLAIDQLTFFLSPWEIATDHGSPPIPTGVITGIHVIAWLIVLAIALLLLWLVARRGNPIARGIYVILELAGLGFALLSLEETLATFAVVPASLMIGQNFLAIVALWLILRPDANAWFAGRPYGLTDIFR